MAVFLCHLEEIAYLCTVELQDEFTAKMHSEFFVDEETDRKHRAGCVWRLLGFDATKADKSIGQRVTVWPMPIAGSGEVSGRTYTTTAKNEPQIWLFQNDSLPLHRTFLKFKT